MQQKMILGTLLAIALASCGQLPRVEGLQLWGSFEGNWSTGIDGTQLRLALVGLEGMGVVSYDNQLQIKDHNPMKSYVLELPQTATEATYELVAYADNNADNKLDVSDTVLGDSCSEYMLYSNVARRGEFWVGSLQTLPVHKGWNRIDSKAVITITQGESYPNFNLFRNNACP